MKNYFMNQQISKLSVLLFSNRMPFISITPATGKVGINTITPTETLLMLKEIFAYKKLYKEEN
jgi:hypothetical protein